MPEVRHDPASPSADPVPARTTRALVRADVMMAVTAGALAVFAVVFVGAFAAQSLSQARISAEVRAIRPMDADVVALTQALIDIETGQRGYLLTRDRVFLEPYVRGKDEIDARFARLRAAAAAFPDFATDIGNARVSTRTAINDIDETLSAAQRGAPTASNLRTQLLNAEVAMDAARARVLVLRQHIERQIENGRERSAASRSAIFLLGALLGLVTIIAVAFASFALRQERRAWRATVTALSEANAAAELAREKAAASDLAKTRFLATASHDMRQPLHALTLHISALERRINGEEARAILNKMSRACASLSGMFSSLLDLARVQADVIEPQLSNFAIQDLIERVTADYPELIAAGASSASIRTDPLLLERVLRNLVSNALRHGGGRAARLDLKTVAGKLEITVSDDGPGIAAEDQQRIFQEFVRLDTRRDGLGLGLAIVSRICTLLDLPLRLQSAPGAGAAFTITAPLAGEIERAAPPAPRAQRLDGARVLVLDDDAHAREAAVGVLRDAGAIADGCANQADIEALLAQAPAPDLLVMDLRIGGELQGIDIANRLCARLAPAPAVLIVTGDTAADTLASLRASGYPWLVKPASPTGLVETAAAQLRSGAGDRNRAIASARVFTPSVR